MDILNVIKSLDRPGVLAQLGFVEFEDKILDKIIKYNYRMEYLDKEKKFIQIILSTEKIPRFENNICLCNYQERKECEKCNHFPVCKWDLKTNLDGLCPFYEEE